MTCSYHLIVFVDLSAAFDTIDHILLNRLENSVGISGSALAWYWYISWYISSRPGETHQIEKLMECTVDIKTG